MRWWERLAQWWTDRREDRKWSGKWGKGWGAGYIQADKDLRARYTAAMEIEARLVRADGSTQVWRSHGQPIPPGPGGPGGQTVHVPAGNYLMTAAGALYAADVEVPEPEVGSTGDDPWCTGLQARQVPNGGSLDLEPVISQRGDAMSVHYPGVRTLWWLDPRAMEAYQSRVKLPEGVSRSPVQVEEIKDANLISSRCTDGLHAPVLDVDFGCRLVPSSTPGHFHLYLDDLRLTWDAYKRLLETLAEAGVIEPGYAKASIARGQTMVRLPGVRKLSAEEGPEGSPAGLAEHAERLRAGAAWLEGLASLGATTDGSEMFVADEGPDGVRRALEVLRRPFPDEAALAEPEGRRSRWSEVAAESVRNLARQLDAADDEPFRHDTDQVAFQSPPPSSQES